LLFVLVATATAQEPTPEPPVYVVQPGDTLFQIAERFGSTVEAIATANDLVNPSLINVGQKLIIPTSQPELVPSSKPKPDTRIHPVSTGDTLPFLAFRYRTTIWALREANDLHGPGPLPLGQQLTIPLPTAVISGTPAFPQVTTRPSPVAQGQTVLVQLQSKEEMAVEGSLLGQSLLFVRHGDEYWALAGVDALTPAEPYRLTLVMTETTSGDVLRMQEPFTVTKGSFTTENIAVPASRQNLLDPTLSQAEARKVNAVLAGVSEQRMWAGTFRLPLPDELRITAGFGQRRSYNGGPVSSYHAGEDLGADEGTPVFAPMTATVALAEPLQVRGNAIILDYGLGVFNGFWHLSQIDVQVGEVVTKGQVIGLVGNTGLSTGPHLHWEMQVLGVPVDPFQWTEQTFP
jgi:murein DD-endopeptidase MepM/ murein hydrolase activator NlpD